MVLWLCHNYVCINNSRPTQDMEEFKLRYLAQMSNKFTIIDELLLQCWWNLYTHKLLRG